jgi:Zn-finger nucleic acid-binding protein
MRSPVYPDINLGPKEIEPGLTAYECPKSGGVWIPLHGYEQWKAQHPANGPAATDHYVPVPDDSGRPALLCPESGCLLLRYKVGHGLQFHVDRSPVTGGIWLDRGEWDALKQKGLHIDLNLIFTASYQRDLRAAEYAETIEKTFQERIGREDFERVTAFKAWMSGHPHRHDIWCYLSDQPK